MISFVKKNAWIAVLCVLIGIVLSFLLSITTRSCSSDTDPGKDIQTTTIENFKQDMAETQAMTDDIQRQIQGIHAKITAIEEKIDEATQQRDATTRLLGDAVTIDDIDDILRDIQGGCAGK